MFNLSSLTIIAVHALCTYTVHCRWRWHVNNICARHTVFFFVKISQNLKGRVNIIYYMYILMAEGIVWRIDFPEAVKTPETTPDETPSRHGYNDYFFRVI